MFSFAHNSIATDLFHIAYMATHHYRNTCVLLHTALRSNALLNILVRKKEKDTYLNVNCVLYHTQVLQ